MVFSKSIRAELAHNPFHSPLHGLHSYNLFHMLKFHNPQLLEEDRFIHSYKSSLLLSNIMRRSIRTFNILPRAFDRVSCPEREEFELDSSFGREGDEFFFFVR